MLVALIIRIICLFLFNGVINYDVESYQIVGNLTKNIVNIYPSPADVRHPYLPFYLYLESFGSIVFLKFLNIVFDLGILYLVYLLSKKDLKTAFLYAVNPVTILISTLHGQFDVIPLFLLLLAVFFLKKRKEVMSMIFFSVSILIKTWPAIFIFVFLKSLKNKPFILISFVFPIMSILIYSLLFKTSPLNIIKTVVGYQGLYGIWGLTQIFTVFPRSTQKIIMVVFVAVLFIYSYFHKEKDLIKRSLNILAFFFFFTPGFSVQYFSWIVPFLILVKKSKSWLLLVLMVTYILSLYSFWLFYPSLPTVPGWLFLVQNGLGIILWLSFGVETTFSIAYFNNQPFFRKFFKVIS